MSNWHIDYRQIRIVVDGVNGGWLGYERDWQSFHVLEANGTPRSYKDPNIRATRANIDWTKCYGCGNTTDDVYGNGWDPYVSAICWACSPSGFGHASVDIYHEFRRPDHWIDVSYSGPACTPGGGGC
jgi:hypothetical protein